MQEDNKLTYKLITHEKLYKKSTNYLKFEDVGHGLLGGVVGGYQHFGGMYLLHLQGGSQNVGNHLHDQMASETRRPCPTNI
jgi:hypothetical protein